MGTYWDRLTGRSPLRKPKYLSLSGWADGVETCGKPRGASTQEAGHETRRAPQIVTPPTPQGRSPQADQARDHAPPEGTLTTVMVECEPCGFLMQTWRPEVEPVTPFHMICHRCEACLQVGK